MGPDSVAPPPGFELDQPQQQVAVPRPPPGFHLDSPSPAPAQEGFGHSLVQPFKDAFAGIRDASANVVRDPLHGIPDFVNSTLKAQGDQFTQAAEAVGEGDYWKAARKGLQGATPFVGPAMDKAGNQMDAGNYAGAAGSTLGNAALFAGPEAVGPLARGAARAAGDAGETVATGLQRSALKPTPKAAGRGVVKRSLREQIPVTEGGSAKAGQIVQDMEHANDAFVDSSPNREVNPGLAATYARDLKNQYVNRAAPTSSLEGVDKILEDFYTADRPGGAISAPGKAARNLTAREAMDIKKATYREVKDTAYGEQKTPPIEAKKAIARAMNDSIKEIYPELGPNLEREGGAIEVQKAVDRAVDRHLAKPTLPYGVPATVTGFAIHGIEGGFVGAGAALLLKIARDPAVKSQIALKLYRASQGLKDFGAAKSLVESRVADLADKTRRDMAPKSDPEAGFVGSIDNPGTSLPRTKQEMYKVGAAILNREGNISLSDFTKKMADEFGTPEDPTGRKATVGSKTIVMDPAVLHAGSKAQLAKFRDLSEAGKDKLGLTPHEVVQERTNVGVGLGGKDWYRGGVDDLVKRYGEPKAREMMTNESIASPNQKLETSVRQMLDWERFKNFGGEEPQFGMYPNNAAAQREMGAASGPKVEPYDWNKKVHLPGGADVPEPRFMPIDTIHTQGSGFTDVPTGNVNKAGKPTFTVVTNQIRAYTDAQLRMEAKRLGVARGGYAQASNWVGTQRGLFSQDSGKARPWARVVMDEIDRREAEGHPVMADTSFDTSAFDQPKPDPKRYAQAASDMEHPDKQGFTITPSGQPYKSGYSYAPSKATETTLNRPLTSKDIKNYERRHQAFLTQTEGNVGGWKDGDRRVLDVSVHTNNLYDALTKAGEGDQDTIYDHALSRTIPVKGAVATVVKLDDGRTLVSESVKHADSKKLPTHLSLIEKAGVDPSHVTSTGWIIDGKYDDGGGGTVGKSEFTLGQYEAEKAARKQSRE